jgi:hypothetical protein
MGLHREPLQVVGGIVAAGTERNAVVDLPAWTLPARLSSGWARVGLDELGAD